MKLIKQFQSIGTALLMACSMHSLVFAEEAAPDMTNLGIGPVKSVSLGAIDPQMTAKGKEIFTVKCSPCHKIGQRLVGPDLADVTKRRSPEWIMNMMLNPQEMTQKDPIAQDLFATYLIQMTFQNIKEDEARAILEYLRDPK